MMSPSQPRAPSPESRRALSLALTLLALACSAPPSVDLAPSEFLTDVTAESGVDFVHHHGATGNYYVPEMMGGGVALLDYDNDDDLDLFFVQGGEFGADAAPWHDSLYRNETPAGGPLRFVQVESSEALPAASAYGMGVATGDFDGDGWTDLYVTRFGANQLLRNQGDGSFEDVTAVAGVGDSHWSVAASFFDYDGDGLLDLYVGNFLDFRVEAHTPCVSAAGWPDYCGPLAYRGVSDRLFRNQGDGTFEDVSVSSGIAAAATNSLGVAARDFDQDGDLDLYVANDSQANTLWINQGDGSFVDRAVMAGCAVNQEGDAEASMGIATGDYDNDGDVDVFLAHLDGESNTLYEMEAGGFCRDATGVKGLAVPSLPLTAFGTAMVDLDLDGWLDIVVANGAIKVIESQLQQGRTMPLAQPDQVFLNRQQDGFIVAPGSPESLTRPAVSRGLAVGDLDDDGRPDLVITRVDESPAILVNRGPAAHWIGIDVRRPDGSPALGVAVRMAGSETPSLGRDARRYPDRVTSVATDGSYLSAHDPRRLWSLGDEAGAVMVEVRTPEGRSQVWSDLAVDRYHRLMLAESDSEITPAQ